MQISPSLPQVKAIAAQGQYRALPVHCEILSDFLTPIEALRILKNVSTHCYLLESALADEKWGRYTFLGYDPKLEITCRDGEMKAGDLRFSTQDPAAYLRQVLAAHRSPSPGGWWGTSPTITWPTRNPRRSVTSRTARPSRMWT